MGSVDAGSDDVLIAADRAVEVVSVSGPDAAGFLNGQLSQDVAAIAAGGSAWSLLLQPQGKVEAWLRVHRLADDEFLLEVDQGWGDGMVKRLSRFKLRVNCELGPVEAWRRLEVRGDSSAVETPDVLAAPSIWPGAPGIDLVGPEVPIPAGVTLDPDAVERARLLAGVPRMGTELDESVIPAEAGTWLVDLSANFTKGCYVGQELVARIESRGSNTPRRLRGVRSASVLHAGDALIDGNGKSVGTVTSVVIADNGTTLGLAFIGRAVEVPGRVGNVEVFEVPVSS